MAAVTWDLVIVGAGITGALLLDKVRRLRPSARVLVVDRAAPAAGATGGSAGVCLPLADVAGRVPLVEAGTAYLAGRPRWREAGLVRPIEAWFVLRPDTFAGFAAAWRGRPLEPVGRVALARLREQVADLRFEPDEVVVRAATDCYVVDAARLTRALLDEHLAGPGIEVWEGCEVRALEPVAGGVVLTLAGGHQVRARTAALATGGWPAPWPEAGRAPAPPVKRMVALQVDLSAGEPLPLVDFIDEQLFLLPQPRGPMTVSFRRNSFAADGERLDTAITEADLAEGRAALARRSVTLAAAITGAHAGYDGYPFDGVPTVTASAAGRVVHVGGMGGSGVRLGPAVADRAADLLLAALHPRRDSTDLGSPPALTAARPHPSEVLR